MGEKQKNQMEGEVLAGLAEYKTFEQFDPETFHDSVQRNISPTTISSIEDTQRIECTNWIAGIVGGIDQDSIKTSHDLIVCLRNGVVLCRLAEEVEKRSLDYYRAPIDSSQVEHNFDVFGAHCSRLGLDPMLHLQALDLDQPNADPVVSRNVVLRLSMCLSHVKFENDLAAAKSTTPVFIFSKNSEELNELFSSRGNNDDNPLPSTPSSSRLRQMPRSLPPSTFDPNNIEQITSPATPRNRSGTNEPKQYSALMLGADINLSPLDKRQSTRIAAQLRERAATENFSDFEVMNFFQIIPGPPPSASSALPQTSPHMFLCILSSNFILNTTSSSSPDEIQDTNERLLAYFIHRLDSVANQSFSVLYFHTDESSYRFEFSFLVRAYSVLSDQFAHNLHRVWLVNSSMWISFAYYVCKPFMDVKFTAKVAVCESFEALRLDVEKAGVQLPEAVVSAQALQKLTPKGIGVWFSWGK
eukprot:c11956_g1_i2.p1 GENE.c11956_g1_i2~~c11956_g1_i2.p1  ORF type:complete len:471 (+),score=110.96 c11956_g1_i2:1-1413(+)